MTKNIHGILLALFISTAAHAAIPDTTIQGIRTEFDVPVTEAFPVEWQSAPISVTAEYLNHNEISRCKTVMIAALKKYPAITLATNLKAVYFFKSMAFYNVGYGGTNSTDALYLTDNGEEQGYTDAYLEQTFHHEFSSILFRNYPALLDTISWKNANIPGFDYNDPESGVGAIRKNQSSQELDTALSAKGFLTQYAYSSLENDVNTLAQNLFKPAAGFWVIVDHYPRINKKVKLLIGFYHQLEATFTENYFRQFDKK